MAARAGDFAKPFRIDDGRKFRLKDVDPGDTGGLHAKDEAPEFLAGQKLSASRLTRSIWRDRFEDINHFEEYLDRNGIVVRKFFLHVSSKEQKKRFLSRLEEPEKNWKFSIQDAREREHWDAYMDAYEDMIRSTATAHAPWYVVPADNKWFTRLTVAAAVIETLEDLDLRFPEVDKAKRKELAAARAILEGSKRAGKAGG